MFCVKELQIQSQQHSACQGLELVKKWCLYFFLRVCGKHLPFSFKHTASQLVWCRKRPLIGEKCHFFLLNQTNSCSEALPHTYSIYLIAAISAQIPWVSFVPTSFL